MISTNDLKNGVALEIDGQLLQVLEFQHVLQNKTAYVRVKLKNLRTGSVTITTFNNGVKVKKAFLDKKEMQYLYSDGVDMYFMDNETYEQIPIPETRLEWEKKFMVENTPVNITFYESEILGVELADKVNLKITKCDPAVRGDTKTNALKDAICETGLLVKVPMFIEEGETIVVSTQTGDYVKRA